MAKKFKTTLLAAALALGVASAAQAWEITIWCYGTNEHCATVITPDVIVVINLGNFVGAEMAF